jgi:hypothetical protein
MLPSETETTQIPDLSSGPATPLITNLVPSGNQLRLAHRKQKSSGILIRWVLPLSISST